MADLKKQIAAGVASITISRDGMTNTVQFR